MVFYLTDETESFKFYKIWVFISSEQNGLVSTVIKNADRGFLLMCFMIFSYLQCPFKISVIGLLDLKIFLVLPLHVTNLQSYAAREKVL
jgi:hypothetical protein